MASTSVEVENQNNIDKKSQVLTKSPKKHVVFLTTSEDKVLVLIAENNQNIPIYGDPILGRVSVKMTCSNCRHFISTDLFYKPSWKSYVATTVCTVIGCCWFPIYFKMYQDGAHFCPLCHVYLGHTATERSWVRHKLLKIPEDPVSHHPHPLH